MKANFSKKTWVILDCWGTLIPYGISILLVSLSSGSDEAATNFALFNMVWAGISFLILFIAANKLVKLKSSIILPILLITAHIAAFMFSLFIASIANMNFNYT